MGWFKDRYPKKAQKLTRVMTTFIGEQDGRSERDLKARFVEIFREQPVVEHAYLALGDHGDGTGVHVTLAIKSSGGEDLSLVRKLQGVFSAMFNSHEHLDVMFIREDQQRQLREVCAPFYQLSG
jgi:SseB protein C-terminal domain